jgi:effector-binding domain-containing protein
MAYSVTIQTVEPRILAAVRKRVAMDRIALECKPALDKVWAFLKRNHGLRTDGHNVFLYHHETPAIMPIDFGVEVTRRFDGSSPDSGEVACVTTPGGEAAQVVHRGHYSQMRGAHEALHQWCAANQRRIGMHSLEIYGDWSDDPAKLETTIQYMLL